MKSKNLAVSPKIKTVNGLISPGELGVTLAHEHCLIDNTAVFTPPKEDIVFEKVTLENAGYLRYNPLQNINNLLLDNETEVISELLLYKKAGGNALVDATNVDLNRDPLALKRISNATGLHIIMGSGYYVKIGQNLERMAKKTEEDLAREMIDDITIGVAGTDICSGLIGEIGCSYPIENCEKKVLRAAGIAQQETGAPLQVHPGRHESSPEEIIHILSEVKADLSKTTICHMERTVFDFNKCCEIADQGCFLEYDLCGLEGYYPESLGVTDIPNDAQRISRIKELISNGYSKKILLSHDICYKARYSIFGGHGYSHILVNLVPAMKRREMSEKEIKGLLIDNPKRFFAF
ncbi:MAG: hypothetical protein PF503_20640 [Desulfobacula sp.]|jgi:phosphotriesterase-related protein|nr:hypothetical protein [Desulfobacula sp.]